MLLFMLTHLIVLGGLCGLLYLEHCRCDPSRLHNYLQWQCVITISVITSAFILRAFINPIVLVLASFFVIGVFTHWSWRWWPCDTPVRQRFRARMDYITILYMAVIINLGVWATTLDSDPYLNDDSWSFQIIGDQIIDTGADEVN